MASELEKIKKGISFLSLGTIFSNVFLFLKALLLIRYFGVEQYGILSLVLGLPILIEIFIVNTDYYLIYRIPKEINKLQDGEPDNRGSLILSSFFIKSISIILTSLILLIFAEQIAGFMQYEQIENSIKIIAIVFMSNIARGPLNIAIFNSFQHYKYSMTSEVLDKLGQLLTTIIAVTLSFSIDEYLIINILSIFPVAIFNNFLLFKKKSDYLGSIQKKNLFQDIRTMVIFSLPNSFRRQLDRYHGVFLRYVIGYILNASAVGIITFVYNIVDLIWAVCLNGQRVFVTSLAKTENKELFAERAKKILVNFNFFMVFVFISLILSAPYITLIVGGSEFQVADGLLRDLSFSLYFIQLSIVIGTYLVFYELNYTYLAIQIVKVILIILFSSLLIYQTQQINLIPWVNNIIVFLEFLFVSRIVLKGLGYKLESAEKFFLVFNVCILILVYISSVILDLYPFYQNFLSLSSIITRSIIFMLSMYIVFLLHRKYNSFVINSYF